MLFGYFRNCRLKKNNKRPWEIADLTASDSSPIKIKEPAATMLQLYATNSF